MKTVDLKQMLNQKNFYSYEDFKIAVRSFYQDDKFEISDKKLASIFEKHNVVIYNKE